MPPTPRDPFIRSVELVRDRIPSFSTYPFHLDAVRSFSSLPLHPKVTYLIGENGTGKSTLLEAIAIAWGFNPEGGTMNFTFSTHASHSELHRYIRLVRGINRPRDGFFFRAETYYNLATNIDEMDSEPGTGRRIIDSYGGKSLHAQSHGESFFAAFVHRFSGHGLYILDEPEAALSPFKQMSMLARIHSLVGKNSQFIISTHSPILMSYPDAAHYQLSASGLHKTTLEDTDHYIVTKQFMTNRERMLKHLLEDAANEE
ncbi:Predicted ATPase [Paenibacillus sp. UNCCL117]|uniref:AAA family ATPase n=1 Tax=unclassified Paenibacillus TaxID=185978 RepID=UPI000887A625|nr:MULTISPECIES: AAA family ATPase [unclassified Paenibacillus]SDE08970.1 Predicted ATPase [Paenibacillus sp. cl123]SFW58833.1 Predicted ATPase [Paenibacillus sp. UNCCL117]